jgi:hypothetical protein
VGAAEALGGSDQDRFRHSVRILAYFAVPEAEHSPATVPQEGGAPRVIFGRLEMLAAVELNRQLGLATGQVDHVAVDNQLP